MIANVTLVTCLGERVTISGSGCLPDAERQEKCVALTRAKK